MSYSQVEQKTLSTLRSFLHRKHSTSGASSTVSSAGDQPNQSANSDHNEPTAKISKLGLDTLSEAATNLPLSYAQARMRPSLKRQWSEGSTVRGVSHLPQQIELSSPTLLHASASSPSLAHAGMSLAHASIPSVHASMPSLSSVNTTMSSATSVHASRLPLAALKGDFTKRKVPVLRRSISSSPVSSTARTPTTTPTNGRNSGGVVDIRTRIRVDGTTRSEGNSPLDCSNKPPVGGTNVAVTTPDGITLEISDDDEARTGQERRTNPSESVPPRSFQSGTTTLFYLLEYVTLGRISKCNDWKKLKIELEPKLCKIIVALQVRGEFQSKTMINMQ